jgi:hypothetical protein
MAGRIIRQVLIYGDDFWEFYNAQKAHVQTKIDWVIGLVRDLPMVPEKFRPIRHPKMNSKGLNG